MSDWLTMWVMHDLASKSATRWTTFTVSLPPCMALHRAQHTFQLSWLTEHAIKPSQARRNTHFPEAVIL